MHNTMTPLDAQKLVNRKIFCNDGCTLFFSSFDQQGKGTSC